MRVVRNSLCASALLALFALAGWNVADSSGKQLQKFADSFYRHWMRIKNLPP